MTMSALAQPRASAAGNVTQLRVLRSEWTKFRSVRSTWWIAAVTVAITVGLGVILSADAAGQRHPSLNPGNFAVRAEIGNLLAQLTIGVLAVLVVTSEYESGMIRASLAVVPRRLPVLWAKLGVVTAFTLLTGLASSVAAFTLGQAAWRAHGLAGIWFGDGDVTRVVLGSALTLTATAVFGLATGALLRSTAGGITMVVGMFFVLPVLAGQLPDNLAALSRFLPSNAGDALWGVAFSPVAMTPWTGFALLCGCAVALVAAAAWRLSRGDA
jgi:ABC-2 type transport system permease protein